MLLTPGLALAQAAAAGSGPTATSLSEIVVTAQKRTERMMDVPVSITSASGSQLAKQGVSNPTQLEKVVAGFTYQPSASGVPVFTLRGIGLYDSAVSAAPAVSVYVDQAPLPFLIMTPGAGLDVERLEVLKGPQGIFFGENSTGGAINYIAAKPTAEPHAGANLTYGRFNQIDADGFVSGPLTDTLRARLAVKHESQDGWQTSLTRPGDTLGRRNFTAARLLLDWAPSDTLSLELNANAWNDKSETQASQFEGFLPSRTTAQGGNQEAYIALQNLALTPKKARLADWDPGINLRRNDRFRQISLRGDLDLGGGTTLSSVTAYAHLDPKLPIDPDGTSFNDLYETITGKIESTFQEIRLAGPLGDRFRYTVGGNYQYDHTHENEAFRYIGTNSGFAPLRYQLFNELVDQKISTAAIFGSGEFKLTDTLTLQGGLRYTKQNRDFQGCLADGGDGALAAAFAFGHAPAPNGGCVTLDAAFNTLPTVKSKLNEDNVSWRVGVNWKPQQNTLIYANITKGYKSGAFTALPAVFAEQLVPVTQESVQAYEAGFKTQFFDQKAQLTGAVFYYDYLNKQILGYKFLAPFGNLPALNNVPKSRVKGGELELTVHPVESLQFKGAVTHIDSRVTRSFVTQDPLSNPVDIKGESFPSTPKWQMAGDAEYNFPVSAGMSAYVGGGVNYRSDTYAAFGANPEFKLKSYALVDLRAGLEAPGGRWRVQVWGRNVTNKYYRIQVTKIIDTIAATTGRPATYGVTLSARY